jgi:pimeloyl-ACP methyl ester carboxylesterase
MRKHANLTRWRAAPALAVLTATLATLVAGAPAASAANRTGTPANGPQPTAHWQTCPNYSDDVLKALGIPAERLPAIRALLARMECGTVSVPLDYRQPRGRHITVAITRLKATDQAHRLGSIALNPGGPGGSGYLMPIDVTATNPESARLNERYDLIGFDPRGVGYSTKVDCPQAGPPSQEEPPLGPITEQAARVVYDREVAALGSCARSDPAFIGQLSTVNVARDLDQVRTALGERKLGFLGVSWGTLLGAVYRSTFPATAGRMFLDSVALPYFRQPYFTDFRQAAAERNFGRMAAWLAQRNATYGLGTTPAQVRASVAELVRDYDANPRRFTDLPMPLDGVIVAVSASQSTRAWPLAGQVIKELREATGPTAPPTVKEVLGGGGSPPPPPPAGTPERFNPVLNRAAICNEDPSRPDFASAWANYQRRLAQNPATGRTDRFSAGCAGWPLPSRPVDLRKAGGPLVLSGHLYETPSPYEWTGQMQDAVGGQVFTVRDDVHGSVLRVPDCAAKLVSFFNTGRIDQGCAGASAEPPSRSAANQFRLTTDTML